MIYMNMPVIPPSYIRSAPQFSRPSQYNLVKVIVPKYNLVNVAVHFKHYLGGYWKKVLIIRWSMQSGPEASFWFMEWITLRNSSNVKFAWSSENWHIFCWIFGIRLEVPKVFSVRLSSVKNLEDGTLQSEVNWSGDPGGTGKQEFCCNKTVGLFPTEARPGIFAFWSIYGRLPVLSCTE